MKFLVIFLVVTTLNPPLQDKMKTYQVQKISQDLVIDGEGHDPLWESANELTDFSYPWQDGTPSMTSFKALHSETWLYCLFTVSDSAVKVFVKDNHKREAVRSDRAEIFFMADSSMSPYYCLEIDPLARVFDCKGEFYRKLDTSWSWPEGQLVVMSHRNENGYTIEIAISKNSLTELRLLNNNELTAGLYRADCIALVNDHATFRWISWVKPDSDKPDFHIPSSFGKMILSK